MSSPTAKRALFSASTPRKRAKTKTIVVRSKGEAKYDDQNHAVTSGLGSGSLITPLTQGDGQGQRIGSKLRISNIEIRWDFTNASTRDNSGVIRLVIPKDPSATMYSFAAAGQQFDPTQYTVLHEIYLNPGHNMTGMYRWKGPLNVQFSGDSSTCVKNHVYLSFNSKSGATVSDVVTTRVWYTDS